MRTAHGPVASRLRSIGAVDGMPDQRWLFLWSRASSDDYPGGFRVLLHSDYEDTEEQGNSSQST